MSPLATRITRLDGAVLAAPAGRIDHAGAAPLEATLAPVCDDARVQALVIDLAAVEYISSIGLRVLMVVARKLRARGARLAISSLTPVVAEIFAISRFDAVLDVFKDVPAALAAVAPGALPAFRRGEPGR